MSNDLDYHSCKKKVEERYHEKIKLHSTPFIQGVQKGTKRSYPEQRY